MPFKFSMWLIAISLFSSVNHASGLVNELYHTERVISAVSSQSELNEAMSNAMEEVLIRVSGDSKVKNIDKINKQLAIARNYLANFRYEASAETLTNVLGEVVRTKKLVMEFDRLRIKNLLTQSNKPIWDEARPSILVFLAVETSSRREVFSSADAHELLDELRNSAIIKGIPYELPLMDIVDELTISPSEVWGLFSDSIETASKRYDNEYTLAGRIYQDSQALWNSDWLVLGSKQGIRFQVSSETSEDLMIQAMNTVATLMSQQYAVTLTGNPEHQIEIAVTDINSLEDYNKALILLNNMSAIKQVNVTSVEGHNISYLLDSYSSKELLVDILGLDQSNFIQLMGDGSGIQLQWVAGTDNLSSQSDVK